MGDIARAQRLYVTERPEGRCDVFEATVDVPATTADLCLVGTFIADALDGLGLVATSTAGVFLAVLRDDMTSDATERIADAALRADPPEAVGDSPIEPRPDPDPVGALAQAHVADLRNRIAQLAQTGRPPARVVPPGSGPRGRDRD